MIHELKINLEFYLAKKSGQKMFELRINDRGYQSGDIVIYTCVNKQNEVLPKLQTTISYVLYEYSDVLKTPWCIYGEKDLKVMEIIK